MKIFKLPDLGEGLPDAIVREWYVKAGDVVKVDQPLAALETAKALVDVSSPYAGKIVKLYGDIGETVETGKPLVGFEGEAEIEKSKDSGTVVGAIEQSDQVLQESAIGIATATAIKATPAVRALAKKLGVSLESITPAQGDRITAEDVSQAAAQLANRSHAAEATGEKLSFMQQAMMQSMTKSHQEVVPVTLTEDADLHCWDKNQDVTLRLLHAIEKACKEVPLLNASFDSKNMSYQLNSNVNIAMAIDTPHGLYAPVLKNISNQNNAELREEIDRLKKLAYEKSLPADLLHGGTIMLSNFGSITGRYANPVLLPPMLAIIGVGRARDAVVAEQGKAVVHRILPLSITADHRLVTGGEIARFLKTLIMDLEKAA
jgi:2-oxoisovalerate dehydrogenase E2 component (dihydrolipoyl transacylase)